MKDDGLTLLPEKYMEAIITEAPDMYRYTIVLVEGNNSECVVFGGTMKTAEDSLRSMAINVIHHVLTHNKKNFNAFNFDCATKEIKFMLMKVLNENGMDNLRPVEASRYKYICQTLSKMVSPSITFESCSSTNI